MKKELKEQVIAAIKANMAQYPNFYVVDIAGLNAGDTAQLPPVGSTQSPALDPDYLGRVLRLVHQHGED